MALVDWFRSRGAEPPSSSPMRRGTPAGRISPRLIEVTLGAWLFASAFLWPELRARVTNTWICGVLCVSVAIVAMGLSWARTFNSALAVWLFVGAWALPTAHVATLWNNVLCSIALFLVSRVPSDTTTLPSGLERLARSA